MGVSAKNNCSGKIQQGQLYVGSRFPSENEDQLAEQECQVRFTGPGPGLGIRKTAVRGAINE